MRQLPVIQSELEMIMQFGLGEIEGDQDAFIDIQTGEIVTVWESDEDCALTLNKEPDANARRREAVQADPDRYASIPQMDTLDHNEMMRKFVRSNWTDDQALRDKAFDAYHGSIGQWKHNIDHDADILRAWHQFEENWAHRCAIEFLAEHGVEPIVKGAPGAP